MFTKKAIVNKFKANEAQCTINKISSILNGTYKLKNSSGDYDTVYFKTIASQVVETTDKRFVSDSDKSTWSNKADRNGSTSVDFNAKTFQASAINPITDNTSKLGTSSKRWLEVNTVTLKANSIGIGQTENILSLINSAITLKGTDAQSVSIESKTDTNITATNSVNVNAKAMNVNGSLNAKGGLNVSGALNLKDKVNVKDNYVTVNSEESGAGITADDKKAGIKIKRGTEKDYLIVFDETDDLLKAGLDTALEPMATRKWATENFNKYTHPATHPASIIVQDANNRFITDAERNAWNNKSNEGHKHNSAEITDATNANTANTVVKRDSSGNFSAGTITASLNGNAATATKLASPKNINGVAFDGTKDIVITAVPSAHNHDKDYLKLSGGNLSDKIIFDNDKGIYGKTTDGVAYTLARILESNNAYIGSTEVPLLIASSANPKARVGSNDYTLYHTGYKPSPGDIGAAPVHSHPYRPDSWVPTWDQVTGKPSVFTPASHTHASKDVTTMTGYAKPSTTSAISVGDSLNTAIGKLEKALDGKSGSGHKHNASEDITGLGSAAYKTAGSSSGNVPVLDSNGKLPESTLPSIAINEKFTANTKAEALKVKLEVGDMMILTADSEPIKTFVCIDSAATVFDDKFKTLSSAADYITKPEVDQLLKNKVDKVSGKGLSTNDYTTADKNKLAGIATNANNYVHPSSHPATIIAQTSTHRFVSDTEKNVWNSKSDAHSHPYLNTSGGTMTGHIKMFKSNLDYTIFHFGESEADTTASWKLAYKGTTSGSDGNEFQIASTTGSIYEYDHLGNIEFVNASGTRYKFYSALNKPTAADIGAATSSHNHDSVYRKKTDVVFDMIKITTPAA